MKREVALSSYESYLVFRNYRKKTQIIYYKNVEFFLNFCSRHSMEYDCADSYIRGYIEYLFKKKYSWSTVNQSYSAIKLFYVNVLKKEWNVKLIPRPRGRTKIPTILSLGQVEDMINETANLKHKLIMLLLYTGGLRINELIGIKLGHILEDRLQLKVEDGKGGKSRIISLPKLTVEFIKAYKVKYRPQHYLIEGPRAHRLYSAASITKIIKKAAGKTGLMFSVSAHSFRYAYATHHIENGTDLVSLQYQLGHSQISTTIKYIYLCQSLTRTLNHPISQLEIKRQ